MLIWMLLRTSLDRVVDMLLFGSYTGCPFSVTLSSNEYGEVCFAWRFHRNQSTVSPTAGRYGVLNIYVLDH